MMLVTVASQQIKSVTVLVLELCLMALCVRVCMFIRVAGGLTVWHLQLFLLKMQIQALAASATPPSIQGYWATDFHKSRLDFNNSTKSFNCTKPILKIFSFSFIYFEANFLVQMSSQHTSEVKNHNMITR